MIDQLTNDDVQIALNELIPCLGVKEKVNISNLLEYLNKKDISGCVSGLAGIFNLPIQVNLSLVSTTYRSDNTDYFQTSSLAKTDWTGHGIESITAQVIIPQNLPLFGTHDFQNYPIQIRVSENCYLHPYTFLAIMAHELSHILLASIGYTKKDNELHTDLVPIISGLGETIEKGRKIVESTTNGSQTITRTTTYGYLPDMQFDYACAYVKILLKGYYTEKRDLQKLINLVLKKMKIAEHNLEVFISYFSFLDKHLVTKMKKEHTDRIIQLHTHDYAPDWKEQINHFQENCKAAEYFIKNLNHFTDRTIELLNTHKEKLQTTSGALDTLNTDISQDNKILGKYIGITHKIANIIQHHS